jgi:hypothetical protein
MTRSSTVGFTGLLIFCVMGCSSQRPVLYPNEQMRKVGQASSDQAIAECMAEADSYLSSGGAAQQKGHDVAKGTATGAAIGGATGAVGGAISGGAGRGAAVGAATGATAGFLGTLFGVFGGDSGPSPTYRNYVERCLRERGYEPIGWE